MFRRVPVRGLVAKMNRRRPSPQVGEGEFLFNWPDIYIYGAFISGCSPWTIRQKWRFGLWAVHMPHPPCTKAAVDQFYRACILANRRSPVRRGTKRKNEPEWTAPRIGRKDRTNNFGKQHQWFRKNIQH